MADSGCLVNQLKRGGGWSSSAVCEGYVHDSAAGKTETAFRLAGSSNVAGGGSMLTRNGGAGGNMTCSVP